VPTLSEVKSISRAQAGREFERQLREWEKHKASGAPIVCPEVSVSVGAKERPVSPPPEPVAMEKEPIAPASGTEGIPEQTAPRGARPAPTAEQATSPVSGPSPGAPAETAQAERAVVQPTPAPMETTREIRTVAGPERQPKAAVTSTEGLIQAVEEEAEKEPVWTGASVVFLLIFAIIAWHFRHKRPVEEPAAPDAKAPAGPAEDFEKLSVEEAVQALGTSPDQGLSAAEAASRLTEYGPNALEEKRVGWLQRLLRYFWGPFPG
jgi:hypothetical protein